MRFPHLKNKQVVTTYDQVRTDNTHYHRTDMRYVMRHSTSKPTRQAMHFSHTTAAKR